MRHDLVQTYAVRAREFSDAVASLGRHTHIGQAFLEAIQETKRLHTLCNAAGDDLYRHIDEHGLGQTFVAVMTDPPERCLAGLSGTADQRAKSGAVQPETSQ